MADVQKKLQALSDSYQSLQAGQPSALLANRWLISEQSSELQ